MHKNPGFDPLTDLAAITRLGNFKFTLAVNAAVPAETVREFVTYVKANPGKISYATPGAGTPAHFLGAMFNRATGTDLVHVPYRGSEAVRESAIVRGYLMARSVAPKRTPHASASKRLSKKVSGKPFPLQMLLL